MMKKFFTLLLLAVTLVSSAQETTLLRLNYTNGDRYIMTMNMNQEMNDSPLMKMNLDISIAIIAVNGDEYDSTMKFTKMVMEMNQGGMEISFDSSKNDDELDDMGKMMKSQMGPILDAVIYAKGNSLGEVLEMKIEPNIPGATEMANQNNNVIYPKKALKVGDTWNAEKENKGIKMSFDYTVKSISKNLVMVTISGTTSGLADGTISGSMNIDRASGVPLKTIIDMDMTLSGQKLKTTLVAIMVKQ